MPPRFHLAAAAFRERALLVSCASRSTEAGNHELEILLKIRRTFARVLGLRRSLSRRFPAEVGAHAAEPTRQHLAAPRPGPPVVDHLGRILHGQGRELNRLPFDISGSRINSLVLNPILPSLSGGGGAAHTGENGFPTWLMKRTRPRPGSPWAAAWRRYFSLSGTRCRPDGLGCSARSPGHA